MDQKQKEIFTATVARTIVKKLMDSDDIKDIMPISNDFINDRFEEEAKKTQFNFHSLNIKELCQTMFLIGFIFSISKENISENEIEATFRIIGKEIQIPFQLNMTAFIWFRQGCKSADTERKNFSVLYNMSNDICQRFGVSNPAPLPTIGQIDNLFKKLDKSIFDDINIDNELIESAFAQISFQSGYILGLNMGNILDDDLLNVAFSEIFEDIFQEAQQVGDSKLAYFLFFREGFHKALTGTRWSFFSINSWKIILLSYK